MEAGEIRIGNYFIKEEKEHMKVMDLNSIFSFRINKNIPVGIFLSQAVEEIRKGDESHKKGIANWVAVLWTTMATVPDLEFLEAVYLCAEDCMKRHPEAYIHIQHHQSQLHRLLLILEVKVEFYLMIQLLHSNMFLRVLLLM